MVPYCMLQDHDFECLLYALVRGFKLVDQSGYMDVEHMDAFIRPLEHIQEELISEVQEMFFRFSGSGNGV